MCVLILLSQLKKLLVYSRKKGFVVVSWVELLHSLCVEAVTKSCSVE